MSLWRLYIHEDSMQIIQGCEGVAQSECGEFSWGEDRLEVAWVCMVKSMSPCGRCPII